MVDNVADLFIEHHGIFKTADRTILTGEFSNPSNCPFRNVEIAANGPEIRFVMLPEELVDLPDVHVCYITSEVKC